MKYPLCSVIIPNWNGKKFLKNCLTSLSKQGFKDFEVIIIDNGSTDGSVLYVKKYFPEVKLVELENNTGFSHAVNLGINKSFGRYVILLNNDTEVDKNCVKNLIVAADKHREVGFVAAKMLNFYKRGVIDSAGSYIDMVGHADNIGRGQKDDPRFNNSGYVFLATGGGSLIKREVFEKVGLLDENFFAYFEDIDFCLRAQIQGFKGWYEPKAIIYHIHKATAKRITAHVEYLLFRNMMQVVIKNFPGELFKKNFNWLKIILVNVNTVRYLTLKGYFWQALKVEAYIVVNFRRLLKKRKEILKSKVVSDQYLIENIRPKEINLFYEQQKNNFGKQGRR